MRIDPSPGADTRSAAGACHFAEAWLQGHMHGASIERMPELVRKSVERGTWHGPGSERAWTLLLQGFEDEALMKRFVEQCRREGIIKGASG